MKKFISILSLLVLGGCITLNHDVKEVGENKYSVSSIGNAFASADTVFNSALKAGKDFCAQKSKKFELITNNGSTSIAGSNGFVSSNAEQRIFFTCL